MSAEDGLSFDLFISYAEADSTWVEGYLLHSLTRAGVRCHSEAAFELGVPRLLQFERAVQGSSRTLLVLSPAYLAEGFSQFTELLAQSYGLETATWPVIPLKLHLVKLPPRLAMLTALDATDPTAWPLVLERLLADLHRPLPPPAERPACPYPGMVPFQADDARFFFGRKAEIDDLLLRLRHQRFLVVVGDSGSGKSSLISAGLLPKLEVSGDFPPGYWLVHTMRPGSQPWQTLSALVGADLGQPAQALSDLLAAHPPAQRLLLVIDPFEELFTQASREDQSTFLAALEALRAVEQCALLIALRGDFFYTDLTETALWPVPLSERLELAPLRGEALRDAIVKPAAREGVYLEPVLVERLLNDAAEERGVLPLVQETMVQLWNRMEERLIRLSAYEELGSGKRSGLAGALVRKADATLLALKRRSPLHVTRAHRIFLRLVQFGEGRPDTRRQLPEAALRSSDDDPEVFDQTVQHLAENRLLTLSGEQEGRDRKVDIAHEALFTEWPALRELVREWRPHEQMRRRLEDWAADWIDRNRDPKALLNELELGQAEEWLRSRAAADLGHSGELAELVKASRAALDEEAAQQRRGRLFRRSALAAIVALLILALGIGLWTSQRMAIQERGAAEEQATLAAEAQAEREEAIAAKEEAQALGTAEATARTKAEEVARIASSRALGAWAMVRLSDQADLALLLAVEAQRTDSTFEARNSLLNALGYSPHLIAWLRGQIGRAIGLAFSQDGQSLASVNGAGVEMQWDLASTKPLSSPLEPGIDSVASVAISQDGRLLAIATCEPPMGLDCGQAEILIWDVASRQPIPPALKGIRSRVTTLVFSPDGSRLASAGCGRFGANPFDCEQVEIRIWDLGLHQPVGRPFGSDPFVTSLAFTHDNLILASASCGRFGSIGFGDDTPLVSYCRQGEIRLWDATAGQQLPTTLIGHRVPATSLAFSPSDARLASASDDETVILWDVASRQPLTPVLAAHTDGVTCVAFSPDGSFLASGSDDKTVILWDTASRQQLGSPLRGHSDTVLDVAFGSGPQGTLLASSSSNGEIILWNADEQKPLVQSLQRPRTVASQVEQMAFNQAGDVLASAHGEDGALLWHVASRQPLEPPLDYQGEAVAAVAFSPDGDTLATAGTTIRLWDVPQRQALGSPLTDTERSWGFGIAFSPDGETLASVGDTIILWDVAARKPRGGPFEGSPEVSSVAFSPRLEFLAGGGCGKPEEGYTCGQGVIYLWDIARAGAPATPLIGHTGRVTSLAFSPDGRLLASGSEDMTILIWDVVERRQVGPPLRGHADQVTSLAFNNDGGLLASGGCHEYDRALCLHGEIRLWDMADHEPYVLPLVGHAHAVTSVAFSPDGKTLASGSVDRTINLWDVDVESWLDTACRTANRNLTQEEWDLFIEPEAPYRCTCPELPPGDGAPSDACAQKD